MVYGSCYLQVIRYNLVLKALYNLVNINIDSNVNKN